MRTRNILLLVAALLLPYLLFYPVPIDPGAWSPPPAPSLEGDYAINQRLDQVQHLFTGQCPQCEDVAIDRSGRIYGGAVNGHILRFDSRQDDSAELFADTGGRPLGLHFDQEGRLLVADAVKGLLSIDTTGAITVLATQHGGRRFAFTDDLEVAGDGMVYFSDASWKFGIENYKLDLLEHRPNGRLLSYDPATGQTALLLDSLYFANGVAVSPDGTFVLVNETGRYLVRRYWLEGPRAGQSEVLIDNLPGFPDGISQGGDGIFWVALASPRNPTLDALLSSPFLRKLLLRLPDFVQPAPENYGFVLGIDAEGKVRYNLQDPEGKFAQITSVQEFDGQLYLGSLHETAVGVVGR